MVTKHKATVTHLEMRARPKNHCPHPMGHIALMRAAEPPVHFYRYLYHVVGKDYIWVHRKQMPDDALRAIIQDERVEIYVLYADGCPAGFCELDFRNMPRAELSFLGVVPEFMGRGFGRFLLCEAIRMAWDKEPDLLTLQTCSLDHPRALPLYQRHGFIPYAQEQVELVDDGSGPGF